MALLAGSALLLAGPVAAEMFPVFPIPWYCHEADLAVEGRVLKGDALRVERIHKGAARGVKVGDTITVLGLGRHDRVAERELGGNGGTPLTADRVVLFLRQDAASKSWKPMATSEAPAQGRLGSAGMYWIQGEEVFVYSQMMNPGPLFLTRASSPYTLAELRNATLRGVRNSEAFHTVLALKDPQAKARALIAYLLQSTSPVGRDTTFRYHVRELLAPLGVHALPLLMEALKVRAQREDVSGVLMILYDLGPRAKPAVPLLTALLDGRDRRNVHYHTIQALRSIGDKAALPALRRVFERGDLTVAGEAAETLAALKDADSYDRIAKRLPTDPLTRDVYNVARLLEALYTLDPAKAREPIMRYAELPAMKGAGGRLRRIIRQYRQR